MDIIQISNILTQLVARYPGGLRAFKNEGGSITAIPTPSNDIIITHPNLPEDIRAAFEKMAKDNVAEPAPHPVIQEEANFENTELIEKHKILSKLASDLGKINDKISIGETPGVLIITASRLKQESKKGDAIREIVSELPDVTLLYLLWKDSVEMMQKGNSWEKEPKAASEVQPLTKDERQQVQSEIDQLLKEIGGISGPEQDT